MHSNYTKVKSDAAGTNLRYMQTPQKERRIRALKQALRNKQRRLQRIEAKLHVLTKQSGVQIDADLQNDFKSIIDSNQDDIGRLPVDDFKRVFWQQQV